MRGGGSKGVWNFAKNSSDLVAESFPYTNICGNRNVQLAQKCKRIHGVFFSKPGGIHLLSAREPPRILSFRPQQELLGRRPISIEEDLEFYSKIFHLSKGSSQRVDLPLPAGVYNVCLLSMNTNSVEILSLKLLKFTV